MTKRGVRPTDYEMKIVLTGHDDIHEKGRQQKIVAVIARLSVKITLGVHTTRQGPYNIILLELISYHCSD